MLRWTTSLSVIAPCLLAAIVSSAGCGDESGDGSGGAGGGATASSSEASSASSASSSSSATSSSASGTGGGMMGCGDTMTDPMNCGACDNLCAPGQTCVAGVCTCGTASVAFPEVESILTQSCATANCHKGNLPKGGLNLEAANAYANLVNKAAKQCNDGRKLVLPGNPTESYIIDKMMGVDLCPNTDRMPPIGPAIGDTKIQVVADWICGGAMP